MLKELPAPVQAGACAALWLAWLGAFAYVAWKEHTYREWGDTIYNWVTVCAILFVFIPAIVNGVCWLVLHRLRDSVKASRADRFAYWTVVGMSFCGIAVSLFGCWMTWILGIVQVRE
jgi:hypothetical protein